MALSGLPELPEGMFWRVRQSYLVPNIGIMQLRLERKWFGSWVLEELLFDPLNTTTQDAAEFCVIEHQKKLDRKKFMKIIEENRGDHGR